MVIIGKHENYPGMISIIGIFSDEKESKQEHTSILVTKTNATYSYIPQAIGFNYVKVILLIILALSTLNAYAGESESTGHDRHKLVEASDFSIDAVPARRERMPILLLVSQNYCPFCVQIKKEILGPMVASGEYLDRLLIREIFIDLGSNVRDFKGKLLTSSAFAHGYNVYLTPTLLFLDPDGNELTERIVGIQTPEMFFYYVDYAVQEAIAAFPGKN